jgi:hypothetical protein
MVQVISREVFRLPASVTGHVTYKTALTKEGIWALTVGIVDPGWSGPVSTTLLNFSSVNKLIDRGDTFLRVTLFEHAPVDPDMLPRPISEGDYAKGVQSLAAARFPPTFLNTDEISAKAGDFVMGRIRNESLIWLGAAVAIFTIVQLVFALAPSVYETLSGTGYETTQIEHLTEQLNRLNSRLDTIERDAVGGKLP